MENKNDLNQVVSSFLGIQVQRHFGRFAEMLAGGYPDPAISAEMDRFFKLTKKMKDINDDSDTFERT